MLSFFYFSTSKFDKLLEKAKNAPNNFRFTEICQLAECYGFEFLKTKQFALDL